MLHAMKKYRQYPVKMHTVSRYVFIKLKLQSTNLEVNVCCSRRNEQNRKTTGTFHIYTNKNLSCLNNMENPIITLITYSLKG